jgi:hypothetical protein
MYQKFLTFKEELKKRYGKDIEMDFEEFQKFAKTAQSKKVYWHLKNFGKITNKECHEIYGIRHAPAVIRDLKDNLKFYSDMRLGIDTIDCSGVDRWGKATPYVEYILTGAA